MPYELSGTQKFFKNPYVKTGFIFSLLIALGLITIGLNFLLGGTASAAAQIAISFVGVAGIVGGSRVAYYAIHTAGGDTAGEIISLGASLTAVLSSVFMVYTLSDDGPTNAVVNMANILSGSSPYSFLIIGLVAGIASTTALIFAWVTEARANAVAVAVAATSRAPGVVPIPAPRTDKLAPLLPGATPTSPATTSTGPAPPSDFRRPAG